jgi:hypothetical protein
VLINTFPWRWILGNQLYMEHVSWDTKMKDVSTEIDSWKLAGVSIRGCSDQNESEVQ